MHLAGGLLGTVAASSFWQVVLRISILLERSPSPELATKLPEAGQHPLPQLI